MKQFYQLKSKLNRKQKQQKASITETVDRAENQAFLMFSLGLPSSAIISGNTI